jgi:hypothetical protein
VKSIELIKSLFKRGVSTDDLKEQLKALDKEKRELRYDQRRLDKEREQAFERTKKARVRGDTSEVMYHLQELKGLDTENRGILRDLTRINKAMIVLRQYSRRLERAERGQNASQIARIIERFKTSPALAGIEQNDLSEEILEEMLDEELAEFDETLGMDGVDALDDRSKELLDAVDAMIEAERSGDEESSNKLKQAWSLPADDLEDDAPAKEPEEEAESNESKLNSD